MSLLRSGLLRALREPSAMAAFDADTWDFVVRQASSAGLLGRLGALARRAGIEGALPLTVRRHLTAALTIAEQQQRAVRWELIQLTDALAELDGPILLLKGAAYAAAELPPAGGRLFSDIDILVPKAQIGATEAALMLDGWVSGQRSAYDQRYYREWMHEIPPMTHIRRQTALDLHHNILPETARLRTRAEPILARARPLPEFPRFSIPTPVDLVLHSATHLFHEGEWEHGLRDLVDLDAMLREFGASPGFWDELLAVAGEMNLGRPLFYGLRYCRRLLETPMPNGLSERCPSRPGDAAASCRGSRPRTTACACGERGRHRSRSTCAATGCACRCTCCFLTSRASRGWRMSRHSSKSRNPRPEAAQARLRCRSSRRQTCERSCVSPLWDSKRFQRRSSVSSFTSTAKTIRPTPTLNSVIAS
jgi:hypothetical protein